MTHRCARRRGDHVGCPLEVDPAKRRRVVREDDGRKMINRIDPGRETTERRGVRYVPLANVASCSREPFTLRVAGQHQRANLPTCIDEARGQPGAQRSAGPRHQSRFVHSCRG